MKKIVHVLDNLMWYIIYTLPILLWLIQSRFAIDVDISSIMSTFSIVDNFIMSSLQSVFGTDGVLPLFDNSSFIFAYMTYFISVMIIHLAVDVLLFIVRWSHDMIDGFYNKCR